MNSINKLLIYSILILFVSSKEGADTKGSQMVKFVFQVDYPFPTADKPQSKLWYMDDGWHVILPKATGPSLWQRTEDGWIEHKNIHKNLQGVPGRVDLWAEEEEITAVGVSEDTLVVFRIQKIKDPTVLWESRILSTMLIPHQEEKAETVTIARDNTRDWWVATVAGTNVYVWSSSNDGRDWEGPIILADKIGEDDICTIARVEEGVIVIWSNQAQESVEMRLHKDGQPPVDWEEKEIIQAGNKTADDHLNTALTSEGTLWLVTKNSVDSIGQPQFVLRVRRPGGHWMNYRYRKLETTKHPSRPIILSIEKSDIILSGHTIYNRENRYMGIIEFGIIDTTHTEILKQVQTVIAPDTTGWTGTNFINDASGPKDPFRQDAPWIILASDGEGRVYEADLSLFFNAR